MIRIRRGVVTALGDARPGAHELEVEVEGERALAIAYPDLVGPVTAGDHVVLNTTAVALGLGTGGVHLVMAVEGREDGDDPPGRVMKARYTPGQTAVRSVEESHRDLLEASAGLRGTPVVVCPLHSMLGPVAAGAKRAGGSPSVVYVMTDGAALPGAFSHLVTDLRAAGLIDGWITAGQAFGGDLEAVTVWTALIAAVEVLEAECDRGRRRPGESRYRDHLGGERPWRRQRPQRRPPTRAAGPSPRSGSALPTPESGTAASRTTR